MSKSLALGIVVFFVFLLITAMNFYCLLESNWNRGEMIMLGIFSSGFGGIVSFLAPISIYRKNNTDAIALSAIFLLLVGIHLFFSFLFVPTVPTSSTSLF